MGIDKALGHFKNSHTAEKVLFFIAVLFLLVSSVLILNFQKLDFKNNIKSSADGWANGIESWQSTFYPAMNKAVSYPADWKISVSNDSDFQILPAYPQSRLEGIYFSKNMNTVLNPLCSGCTLKKETLNISGSEYQIDVAYNPSTKVYSTFTGTNELEVNCTNQNICKSVYLNFEASNAASLAAEIKIIDSIN